MASSPQSKRSCRVFFGREGTRVFVLDQISLDSNFQYCYTYFALQLAISMRILKSRRRNLKKKFIIDCENKDVCFKVSSMPKKHMADKETSV